MSTFESLNHRIVSCERCPRLREWCRTIAIEKRAAYRDDDYWGQPVPNFGDPQARLLVVGLAPGAHGANRTGRMFTGDRSGDWLYRALHTAGFASQSASTNRDDGLTLTGAAVTNACHCAPPGNKPSKEELVHCEEWFDRAVDVLPVRVFLALGQIAFRAVVDLARRREWQSGRLPKFAHGAHVDLGDGRHLLGSYHVSQQNTFTGRLTEAMLDDVFQQAKSLLSSTSSVAE